MRVIYPNRLKATISNWIEHQHRETFKFPQEIPITELNDLIEITPTVKAIPIEWIKKQVKDGWYDIIEIMYHWEIENNIKKSILWSEENEQRENSSPEL